MSQIDNFISKMNQGHYERAVLRNDKPVLLYRGGEQTAGPVISGTQLIRDYSRKIARGNQDRKLVGFSL